MAVGTGRIMVLTFCMPRIVLYLTIMLDNAPMDPITSGDTALLSNQLDVVPSPPPNSHTSNAPSSLPSPDLLVPRGPPTPMNIIPCSLLPIIPSINVFWSFLPFPIRSLSSMPSPMAPKCSSSIAPSQGWGRRRVTSHWNSLRSPSITRIQSSMK